MRELKKERKICMLALPLKQPPNVPFPVRGRPQRNKRIS
jgi:hypothetical protein